MNLSQFNAIPLQWFFKNADDVERFKVKNVWKRWKPYRYNKYTTSDLH